MQHGETKKRSTCCSDEELQLDIKKRKRSANFSQEEKLKFLRLLQEKGKVIITKVASHDSNTNRIKEQTWNVICHELNSSGFEWAPMRTTHTLKKLWQKLKSEAKAFRLLAGRQDQGEGGPPIKIDSPVLELVLVMTRRGRSESEEIGDPDSEQDSPLVKIESCTPQQTKSEKKWRKSPQEEPNESINSFANERINSERAKYNLIRLKNEQEMELHALRMENERQLFALKEKILGTVLQRVQGQRLAASDAIKRESETDYMSFSLELKGLMNSPNDVIPGQRKDGEALDSSIVFASKLN